MNILTDLAAAYLSDLQFHKAREYAEMAVQIDPNSNIATEVLANIGRFQRKLGRFAEWLQSRLCGYIRAPQDCPPCLSTI